jgi:hypothetical protein
MRHRLQLQLGRWIIAATIGLTGCTYGLWQRASGQTKSADDQLSKYTFQELRQALDTRHNMALYPHSPVGIDKFTDRQIVDNIVGRQKAIYPHDRRRDYYQFKVHPDYERNSNSVAAIVVPPNFTWEHDIFRGNMVCVKISRFWSRRRLPTVQRLSSGQTRLQQRIIA